MILEETRKIFYNPWIWTAAAAAGFGLCTFLPIWIKDGKIRRRVNWFILIPASLLILFYVYPAGIEFCRRLAVR